MSVLARVVHSIPGRTRLRADAIKGDVQALEAVQTALEDTKGVQNVHIDALTGSILVEHDASLDELIQQLEHRDVLELDNSEPEHSLATLHRISFFGFVGAGIYQCFNNHGLPAGAPALRRRARHLHRDRPSPIGDRESAERAGHAQGVKKERAALGSAGARAIGLGER